MAPNKAVLARLKTMEAKLDKAIRRMNRMENLLNDAGQKLCHLIKRQREYLRQGPVGTESD